MTWDIRTWQGLMHRGFNLVALLSNNGLVLYQYWIICILLVPFLVPEISANELKTVHIQNLTPFLTSKRKFCVLFYCTRSSLEGRLLCAFALCFFQSLVNSLYRGCETVTRWCELSEYSLEMCSGWFSHRSVGELGLMGDLVSTHFYGIEGFPSSSIMYTPLLPQCWKASRRDTGTSLGRQK